MDSTSKPSTVATLIGRFAIPVVVAAGTTATTVAALGHMPGAPVKTTAVEPVKSVSLVKFTAFSEDEVTYAIRDVCVLTGCDEADLHPMIKAYADAMTPEELDAARWAQVRLLAHGMRSLEAAAPGSNAADLAHLELTAAARIAHFYTEKLNASR